LSQAQNSSYVFSLFVINYSSSLCFLTAKRRNNKLKIYADGQHVEQVSQFRCLGSLISEDGYS